MNKNGFIATSLIYSFFLIFVTLFLAIIADYLQNKVLLNTIEKGIKDELNSTMSIEDFEVGDMISFDDDEDDKVSYMPWIIVKVDYNNKKLVLYSYELTDSKDELISFPNCSTDFPSSPQTNFFSDLSDSNLENDIEIGYRNATYLNKILYNYSNMDTKKKYNIGENNVISSECSLCIDSVGAKCNANEEGCNCTKNPFDIIPNKCKTDGSSSNYRKRLELTIGNINFEKIETMGDGTILLKCK